MPLDLIGREGWRRRGLAQAAVADALALAQGAGVRAECVACGGYSPRPSGGSSLGWWTKLKAVFS